MKVLPRLFLSLAVFLLAAGWAVEVPIAMPDGAGYPRSREAIYEGFHQLVSDYPGFVTADRIGDSYRSRSAEPSQTNGIWAFRIGSGAAPARESIVLVAGQHAREVAGPEVLLRLTELLLSSAGTDPLIADALQQVDLWLIPLANPDGYDEVIAGRVSWRKNANDTANQPGDAVRTLPEGIGVDLNRNFPFGWGLAAPPDRAGTGWRGAGSLPYEADYQGSTAGSEPETQAIMAFVERVSPNVLVAYHSPLEAVIWPWGHRFQPAADDETLAAIGQRIASEYGYAAGRTSERIGFTTGDVVDWAYGTVGSYAFGVELGFGFAPTQAEVDLLSEHTYRSMRFLLSGVASGQAIDWAAPRIAGLEASTTGTEIGMRAAITATIESALGTPADPLAAAEVVVGPLSGGRRVPMTVLSPGAEPALAVVQLELPSGQHDIWVVARSAAGRTGVPEATRVAWLPYRVHAPALLLR